MALTRKFLSALGIESDKIDEIISAHAETVDALKDERDNFKAKAENFDSIKNELETLKKGDSYKDKYDAIKKEFDIYKSEQAARTLNEKKLNAKKEILKTVGIPEKYIDKILKLSNDESIKWNEDGSIADSKQFTDEIKSEWSDFIPEDGAKGADTKKPPHSDVSDKEQYEKLSLGEQMKFANEHPDIVKDFYK